VQVALRNAGDLHSLAGDKGYDWMALREKLREKGVRPLLKHREFRPVDHAHNARIDGPRYRKRALCESVFPRSSARSGTPCVPERGTESSENSS
jgi:IS5 family transposase